MNLKQISFSIFILLISTLYAQDTIYFDKYEAEINNPKKAKFYRVICRDSVDKNLATATEYFKSGKMKSKANFINESSVPAKERKTGVRAFILDKDAKTKWLYNGKYMEWYKTGKLKKDIDFKNGGHNNQLITYWRNGKIKRQDVYDNSWKKVKGECFVSNGQPDEYTTYFTSPIFYYNEFLSMQNFINKNFQYPELTSKKQFMGKMSIYSFVDSRGKFYKNLITKGIHPELDNVVSKLLTKLPSCMTPAMCDGSPTSYNLISSVIFCKPIYTENLFMNPTGNDSVFYNKDGFIQEARHRAESIEHLSTSSENSNLLIQTTFYSSGKIKSSTTIDKAMSVQKLKETYKNLNSNSSIPVRTEFIRNRVLNGQLMNWYENGQLKNQLNYLTNKMHGEQVYFAEDGKVTNRAVFENGKLLSGNIPVEKEYTVVEIMPQFPGGESELKQYINNSIRYPVSAFVKKVSGKVVVHFVVEMDGSIGRVEVLRSVDPDLDAEAVRVVQNMPNWTPGVQNGVFVPVRYTMPISFNLDYGEINPLSSPNQNTLNRNNSFNKSFPTTRY